MGKPRATPDFREKVAKRLEQLKKDREAFRLQVEAQLHGASGAIQELENLLNGT
jgi:hypothetical protein